MHSVHHLFATNIPVLLHVALRTLVPLQQPQLSLQVCAPLCLLPGGTGTIFALSNLTLYADDPVVLGSLSSVLGRMQPLVARARARKQFGLFVNGKRQCVFFVQQRVATRDNTDVSRAPYSGGVVATKSDWSAAVSAAAATLWASPLVSHATTRGDRRRDRTRAW
jgi:hypothetical protein